MQPDTRLNRLTAYVNMESDDDMDGRKNSRSRSSPTRTHTYTHINIHTCRRKHTIMHTKPVLFTLSMLFALLIIWLIKAHVTRTLQSGSAPTYDTLLMSDSLTALNCTIEFHCYFVLPFGFKMFPLVSSESGQIKSK